MRSNHNFVHTLVRDPRTIRMGEVQTGTRERETSKTENGGGEVWVGFKVGFHPLSPGNINHRKMEGM